MDDTDSGYDQDPFAVGVERKIEELVIDSGKKARKDEEGSKHDLWIDDAEKKVKEEVTAIELPSTVIDREEIYIPHNISKDDPSIYGKWLIFSRGNLKRQDYIWIQLQNLLQNGYLILLGSSTAKSCDDHGPSEGVIKCYTCKDIKVIKLAGLAIQNILKDDTILNYKTNQASQDNLYTGRGKRYITNFMLTVSGKLYERDKLRRWKEITDTEYHNYTFEEKYSKSYPNTRRQSKSESNFLPSEETRKNKQRYVYPEDVHLNNFSGVWFLYCSIADADDNGLTELDRTWIEAKALRDKKIFKSVTCETYALKQHSGKDFFRRAVMCELYDYCDIDRVILCADKLRERISYDFPMYFKIFCFNEAGKFRFQSKYIYTDDRQLYEYVEKNWKLIKRT